MTDGEDNGSAVAPQAPARGKHWRHHEIAELLGSLVIKSTHHFLEKDQDWICPACRRSKAQIVAPGHNVDIIAAVHRHHDHIQDLIWGLVPATPAQDVRYYERRRELIAALERRFCRFQPTDICQACNALDPAAKEIVGAPKWFSFSPHGIGSMILRPVRPYASKHEIDRPRLDVIWDKVSREIDGLEDRIKRAIQQERLAS